MALPSETFAVLIGIEDYDISNEPNQERWDLRGPAADALRFAQWLRQRQVPPENIHVFLSPLDPAKVFHAFADLGISQGKIAAPTQTNLENFFRATIATLGTEGAGQLFLLWGGHGVIRETAKRFLYCSDAIPEAYRALQLDQQILLPLRKLKSLPKQFVFIDACANEHELRGLPEPFTHSGPVGVTLSGVQQYTLLAASAGQLAQNRDAGVFSTLLLNTLDPLGLNPDFTQIEKEVLEEFDKLSAQDPEFDQTPISITVEDHTNRSQTHIYGGTPVPRSLHALARAIDYPIGLLQRIALQAALCPSLAKAQDRRHFYQKLSLPEPTFVADDEYDRLNLLGRVIDGKLEKPFLTELKSLDLNAFSELLQSFERAALVNGALQLLRSSPFPPSELRSISSLVTGVAGPSSSLEQILSHLAGEGAAKSAKLFDFLFRLSERPSCKDPGALRDWVKRHADPECYLDLETQSRLRRSYRIVVSVKSKPGEDETPGSITSWLLENESPKGTPQTVAIDKPEDLTQALEHALARSLEKVGQSDASIEISVPLTMMRFDFHKLGIRKKNAAFKRLFCHLYPLSIRWRDRCSDSVYARSWRSAVDQVYRRVKVNAKPKHSTLPASPSEQYLLSLETAPSDFIFLGAIPKPASEEDCDWLQQVIVYGAPFAAWTAQEPANPPEVSALIETLLTGPFDQLPHRAREIRLKDNYADLHSMTLLWDGPQQFQPELLNEPT